MNEEIFSKLWFKGTKRDLALKKVSREIKMTLFEIEALLKAADEFSHLPMPDTCLTKSQAQHMLKCEYCNKLAFNLPSAATANPVPAACLRRDAARHLSECDRCKKLMLAFKVKAKIQKEIESP